MGYVGWKGVEKVRIGRRGVGACEDFVGSEALGEQRVGGVGLGRMRRVGGKGWKRCVLEIGCGGVTG